MCPLVVVLGAGLLPDAVDDFGVLRGCRSGGRYARLGAQRGTGGFNGRERESAYRHSAADSRDRQANHRNLALISPEAETRRPDCLISPIELTITVFFIR
jgi:hypothetical protein